MAIHLLVGDIYVKTYAGSNQGSGKGKKTVFSANAVLRFSGFYGPTTTGTGKRT
jgi:hypothetical protein